MKKKYVFILLFLNLIIFFISDFVRSKLIYAEEFKRAEELPEVVVTATRTEVEVEKAPASVEVVKKEKIEIKKPKTIDEALNDIPGVMIRRGKGLMDTLSTITLEDLDNNKEHLFLWMEFL